MKEEPVAYGNDGVTGIPATGSYCIETLECGVWDTFDTVADLHAAIILARGLCGNLPDDRIRISTPDYRIL